MTAQSTFAAVSEIVKIFTDHYGTANVHLPNRTFTLPSSTSTGWARVRIAHTDSGQASLAGGTGARMWSRNGIGTIELYTQTGVGVQAAYTAAEAVRDLYQGTATPSGVWFRGVRVEEVTDDDQGAWYQIDVAFEFEYDQIT